MVKQIKNRNSLDKKKERTKERFLEKEKIVWKRSKSMQKLTEIRLNILQSWDRKTNRTGLTTAIRKRERERERDR